MIVDFDTHLGERTFKALSHLGAEMVFFFVKKKPNRLRWDSGRFKCLKRVLWTYIHSNDSLDMFWSQIYVLAPNMSGVCPWTGLLPNTDIGRIGLQSWFSIGFPYKTWIFQYTVSPGSCGVVWTSASYRVEKTSFSSVSERFWTFWDDYWALLCRSKRKL